MSYAPSRSPDPSPGRWTRIVRLLPLPLLAAGVLLTVRPACAQFSRAADTQALGTGAVEGTVTLPAGAAGSLADLSVAVVGTDALSLVDGHGRYSFPKLAPGVYTLAITGKYVSTLKIIDVSVAPGTITQVAAHRLPASSGPAVSSNAGEGSGVTALEQYLVTDDRAKPFAGTDNIDLPRSINDAQPYYVWDASQIAVSGATNLEDFLQRSVPMDTNRNVNAQSGTQLLGNVSNVKLGGLSAGDTSGTQNTLILVDGRPIPTINYQNSSYQGDINGIPLGAVDHIEVLTSSASAIYGPSAAGGAINIVLKHDYTGAELRFTYENTFDSDSPIRTYSVTAGSNLEGGKTNLLVTASFTDAKPLLLQDRASLVLPYLNRYFSLYPGGEAGYIGLTSGRVYYPQVFVVSGNSTPLFSGSAATFVQVPAGYAGPALSGTAALRANVGNYSLGLPNTSSTPLGPGLLAGLLTPITQGPKTKALSIDFRRQMTKRIEFFVDFSNESNISISPFDRAGDFFSVSVPASAPTNPFGQAVTVYGAENVGTPITSKSDTHQVTTGFKLDLPGDWKADVDYTWGQTNFSYAYENYDSTALAAAVASGAVNPIADYYSHPLPLQNYPEYLSYTAPTTVNDLRIRAAGPVYTLPAGDVTLSLTGEHQVQGSGTGISTQVTPLNPADGTYATFYPGEGRTDDSGGFEGFIPLIAKSNKLTLVRQLDLQVALREDAYHLNGTSPISETAYGYNAYSVAGYAGGIEYSPTAAADHSTPLATAPSVGTYHSGNGVVGLRYKPVDDVLLRFSGSSAFTPPSISQALAPVSTATFTPTGATNPGVPTSSPWSYSQIVDPVLGTTYAVPVKSGGNPAIQPETARAFDWGVILEPRWIPGLRLSIDYSRVTKHNNISTLSAQNLVNNAATFPGRVTRGTPAAGAAVGPITLIDTTSLNLYKTMSSSYITELDYVFKTGRIGTWKLFAIADFWQYYNVQNTLNGPYLHELGNPNYDGFGDGLGLAKFKGNAGLSWQNGPWTAGWQMRYTGPYTIGSANGLGGASPYYSGTVNGWISGQIYHDVYVGYELGKAPKGSSWWRRALAETSLQFGIKNLFNHYPPYDAFESSNYATAYSPYGDARLADYYITLKKDL